MPNAKKTYHDSPHKMVEKWDTPILCIHGEKDYRINYTQGMQAFNAARMKGIPEPTISEYTAITGVFQEIGITDIWGE